MLIQSCFRLCAKETRLLEVGILLTILLMRIQLVVGRWLSLTQASVALQQVPPSIPSHRTVRDQIGDATHHLVRLIVWKSWHRRQSRHVRESVGHALLEMVNLRSELVTPCDDCRRREKASSIMRGSGLFNRIQGHWEDILMHARSSGHAQMRRVAIGLVADIIVIQVARIINSMTKRP